MPRRDVDLYFVDKHWSDCTPGLKTRPTVIVGPAYRHRGSGTQGWC
jgi:hypothetical protein